MRFIHFFLLSLCFVCLSTQTQLFENTSVIKTVDLSNAIVKVTLRFSVHPLESSLKEYYVAIPKEEMEHLAYISSNGGKNNAVTIQNAENQEK